MRLVAPADAQQNRQFAEWAAERLDCTYSEPFVAQAIVDDKFNIAGVIVYTHYDGHDVHLSGVGAGAFTPSVVRGIAARVFDELRCARATFRTRKSNKRVRRLLSKHFTFEAVIECGFGNEDAFQYKMVKAKCRWLENKQ